MAISPKDRLPKGTESLILLIYYISDSFLEHSMYSINIYLQAGRRSYLMFSSLAVQSYIANLVEDELSRVIQRA